MTPPPLSLYYDGLCPLCSREIDYYRKRAKEDRNVLFIDITEPTFEAAAHGLNAVRIHRLMHVKVGDKVHTGVDAFLAIWDRIPGHAWMARLGRLPIIYQMLCLGYAVFAWVRPMLPRRKRDCDTGACRGS